MILHLTPWQIKAMLYVACFLSVIAQVATAQGQFIENAGLTPYQRNSVSPTKTHSSFGKSIRKPFSKLNLFRKQNQSQPQPTRSKSFWKNSSRSGRSASLKKTIAPSKQSKHFRRIKDSRPECLPK